jgi:hypothetical protein
MLLKQKLIFLGLFLSKSLCYAGDSIEYSNVNEFINSLPTKNEIVIQSVADGDLNGDGLSDKVILVSQKIDNILVPKIFILLQAKTGGFNLVQETGTGDALSVTSVQIQIQKGSLFVQLEAIRGLWTTHQFKYYKNKWRLIGFFMHSADFGAPSDSHDKGVVVETDINTLTGDIVFKTEYFSADKQKRIVKKDKAYGEECTLADYGFDYSFCVSTWKTKSGETVDSLLWAQLK